MQIRKFSVDEFNDEIKRLVFDYVSSGEDKYIEQARKMIDEEIKKRQLPPDESE